MICMIFITSWESICLIAYSDNVLCITQVDCLTRRSLRFKKALQFFSKQHQEIYHYQKILCLKTVRIVRFCLLEYAVAGAWDAEHRKQITGKMGKKVPKWQRTFLYIYCMLCYFISHKKIKTHKHLQPQILKTAAFHH